MSKRKNPSAVSALGGPSKRSGFSVRWFLFVAAVIAAGVFILPGTHPGSAIDPAPAPVSTSHPGPPAEPEPAPADEIARKLRHACDALPAATGFYCESIDTDGG